MRTLKFKAQPTKQVSLFVRHLLPSQLASDYRTVRGQGGTPDLSLLSGVGFSAGREQGRIGQQESTPAGRGQSGVDRQESTPTGRRQSSIGQQGTTLAERGQDGISQQDNTPADGGQDGINLE